MFVSCTVLLYSTIQQSAEVKGTYIMTLRHILRYVQHIVQNTLIQIDLKQKARHFNSI